MQDCVTSCGAFHKRAAAQVEMSRYANTEKRIGPLTWALGALAAIGAALIYSIRIGAGVFAGAALAALNYHWLAGALDSVARASSAQAGSPQARVPLGSYGKLIGRYLLIGVVVYVIFIALHIPIVSMLVGMCALGAATIVASLYEIFDPGTK